MKKILLVLLTVLFVGLSTNSADATVKYPAPTKPVCIEGQLSVVDNQKFKISILAYRWHIVSQTSSEVTYQLQLDIDPTNKEKWIDVKGETKTFEIPTCETDTPESTPSARVDGGSTPPSGQSSTTGAPVCGDTAPTQAPANFHIKRLGDTAIAQWFPTGGASAHVFWKIAGASAWEHSLADIANTGYAEIHGLGDRDWTFAAQQANGCSAGPMSQEVVDGNTLDWIIFR